MLAGLDADELAYWKAKERVDGPLGYHRFDYAMSRILLYLSAPHSEHPLSLEDFLPSWLVPKGLQPTQTEEEMKANFLAAKAAFEGFDNG